VPAALAREGNEPHGCNPENGPNDLFAVFAVLESGDRASATSGKPTATDRKTAAFQRSARRCAIENARVRYVEQSLWQEAERNGYATESWDGLSQLQPTLDVNDPSGIASRWSGLFSAFSAWSHSPDDQAIRQSVLTSADQLAASFQEAYAELNRVGESMVWRIGCAVRKINCLAADIAILNGEAKSPSSVPQINDRVYADLEELAALTNATIHQASDGTFTVLIGGRSPLVAGNRAYGICTEAVATGALPTVRVLDGNNRDITAAITGGSLGAGLSAYNSTLASLLGNGAVAGRLNDLAMALAGNARSTLSCRAAGGVARAVPLAPGVPLFDLDSGLPPAAYISLHRGATVSNLADIEPAAVTGGIYQRLAALAHRTDAAGELNAQSYSDCFKSLASDVGQQISSARTLRQRHKQLLAQSRNLRRRLCRVSFDVHDTQLTELEERYEATARVFKIMAVLNSLIDSLLSALSVNSLQQM